MKVAIIKPPLYGHQKRGIGIYTNHLIDSLCKLKNIELVIGETGNLPDNVDLYHFPYFDPFFVTLPLLRKKPTIVTIHDLIPLKFPDKFPVGLKGKIKWYWQRYKIKRVEAIITDSHYIKNDVVKILKINVQKIFPIYLAPDKIYYNKVNQDEKNFITKKYHLPKEFILFVGEANWNKNLPNIIKAATLAKTKLVIISRGFEQVSTVHPWTINLQQSQQLAKNNAYVQALGFMTDTELNTIYKIAKALVFPSLYEGFGLPIVEAFAAGCPVITSDKGSLLEVADAAAIIVNPDNINDISRQIIKLINDSEFRNRLIDKGFSRVKIFSWKNTAEETLKVYNQVINKPDQY